MNQGGLKWSAHFRLILFETWTPGLFSHLGEQESLCCLHFGLFCFARRTSLSFLGESLTVITFRGDEKQLGKWPTKKRFVGGKTFQTSEDAWVTWKAGLKVPNVVLGELRSRWWVFSYQMRSWRNPKSWKSQGSKGAKCDVPQSTHLFLVGSEWCSYLAVFQR